MAELLIFTRNNTHPDPVKDRRGCYKRGHIVRVEADGFGWGACESKAAWIAAGRDVALWPGDFVIVKIPGVSVATVNALIDHQTEDDAGAPVTDAEGKPVVFRRRRWRAAVDSIPSAIRNQLLTNGEVTVTPTQIKNYIQRVRDNTVFSGL